MAAQILWLKQGALDGAVSMPKAGHASLVSPRAYGVPGIFQASSATLTDTVRHAPR